MDCQGTSGCSEGESEEGPGEGGPGREGGLLELGTGLFAGTVD